LLLGLVKDLFDGFLKYLKAQNLKDRFDKHFTSVPWYPGLQLFQKTFDSSKSGTSQGKEIRGMVRTLAVDCVPILAGTMDETNADEISSDEEVMGTMRALSEFCLLISQQSHSDLSLTAFDDVLKQFYRLKSVSENRKCQRPQKPKS
jgi:hypothetical protein